jgi:ABC-type lipoprotein export system ATPase subunit
MTLIYVLLLAKQLLVEIKLLVKQHVMVFLIAKVGSGKTKMTNVIPVMTYLNMLRALVLVGFNHALVQIQLLANKIMICLVGHMGLLKL